MELHFHKRFATYSLAVAVLIAAGAAFFLTRTEMVELKTGRFTIMGTFAQMRLYCRDEHLGRAALEKAQAALEHVDKLMSTYRSDSELSQINQQADRQAVPVSAETYNLLRKAQDYAVLTDGAFDITVTPLLQLWKKTAQENRLPNDEEMTQVRLRMGYENLQLSDTSERTVAFAVAGMELNVDAIAKGYAVDRALAALRQAGVVSALVEIGGEVGCFGPGKTSHGWLVGIQDPFADDNDDPLSQQARWALRLRDQAVATSGNYRQFVIIEGQQVSHIIDPRSGKPADILPSVTVIAPEAIDADALATAVSVLGAQDGIALIESLENTEAFLVAGAKQNPQIYRSSGIDKYEVRQ